MVALGVVTRRCAESGIAKDDGGASDSSSKTASFGLCRLLELASRHGVGWARIALSI